MGAKSLQFRRGDLIHRKSGQENSSTRINEAAASSDLPVFP